MGKYYVYVLFDVHNTNYYVGITDDLEKRIYEHKYLASGTKVGKEGLNKLVYFESVKGPIEAYEKQMYLEGRLKISDNNFIKRDNEYLTDLYGKLNFYK